MNYLEKQADLFPQGALPDGAELLLADDKQRELYPLTTVERNQSRLQSIIFLLGAGVPKQFICDAHQVGWYTLQRIAEKHGEKITDIKRRTASKGVMFVELGVDQLIEDVQSKKLRGEKLAFTLKQVFDMVQLMSGDPTSIVASPGAPRLTADTLKARLASMKSADPVDAVLLPTGSDAGNLSPLAADAPGAGSNQPGADNQSTQK